MNKHNNNKIHMKIVFFSSDNNLSSGAFKAEIHLIKDLLANGHDIILVLPGLGSGTKLVKQNQIKYKIIKSHPWVCNCPKKWSDKLSHLFTSPINDLAKKKTKKFLLKIKPDLVVVNTAWNGIGGEVAQTLGIPVVWHLREILEKGQNKQFFDIPNSSKIISNSNICLPVSKAVYEYYLDKIPAKKMKIIYDGVNETIFYKDRNDLFKDKITHILMVGTVFHNKGQYLAIKALNELPNHGFDLTIVGNCSPVYKKQLLELGPNIKDRIVFEHPTTSVHKFYHKADLFLMNSIGEAFGLVTVEAMMSGLPIIASKCDGNKEIIENKNNGYFYEPGNYLDLKEKIEYVLAHKTEAVAKSKLGQQHVLTKFTKLLNSKNIEDVYKNIVNKKNI